MGSWCPTCELVKEKARKIYKGSRGYLKEAEKKAGTKNKLNTALAVQLP